MKNNTSNLIINILFLLDDKVENERKEKKRIDSQNDLQKIVKFSSNLIKILYLNLAQIQFWVCGSVKYIEGELYRPLLFYSTRKISLYNWHFIKRKEKITCGGDQKSKANKKHVLGWDATTKTKTRHYSCLAYNR